MKKENFVSMLMGTIGTILFGIGMCMCLLPDWNAFNQGVVLSCIGGVILLAMLIVRRKMQNKPALVLNAKSIGATALGILGALVLGIGMCMAMVWTNLMLPGIIVGCVGIIMLIMLIPLCKGIK